jgi:seryl-tRNA synthetase
MNYVVREPLETADQPLHEPTGINGVYGRTALFERVIDALSAFISQQREPDTEILRFPPVISRTDIEKSGYLQSFPHLLGAVCCLHGDEARIRAAADRPAGGWTQALTATDLVLAPAACYHLYPLVARRGMLPAAGSLFDVACDCFRHEPSRDADRLQTFRMREYVRIGAPEEVRDFRARWMARSSEFARSLGLPGRLAPASDPFFGRVAKFLADSQVEQELKFELLIPVRSAQHPTACMSFNYHRDHFGTKWGLRTDTGDVAHTACVAFGMDRMALAMFATHGTDLQRWPAQVRDVLSI